MSKNLTISTSKSQDIYYCQKEGHSNNPLNIVCINYHCANRGVICSHCLLSDHNDHVKQCVTLAQLTQSLNKSNNSVILEDIGNCGCEILKKHKQIIVGFKIAITQIRKSVDKIESAIESQMKKLLEDADIYVGDALENLLKKINSQSLDINKLHKDIVKFMPLIEINKEGQVESLTAQRRSAEVSRIIQSAGLLEREVNYWMQKCSEDLDSLINKVMDVSYERPVQLQSDNRFGITLDNWSMEGINAITFQLTQNLKQKDVWLVGFGMYQFTIPESQILPKITVSLSEGEIAGNKRILDEEISAQDICSYSLNKMNSIILQTATKLNYKNKYTLGVSTNQKLISYAGMNGSSITTNFEYFDSQFSAPSDNNGTTALVGLIPYLIYEIR